MVNTKMNKKKVHVFGKDYYLLGCDVNATKYYLNAFSFDCDWYYGGGYITTFTNNNKPQLSRDIASYQHFDSMFINGKGCIHDNFKNFFVKTTLSDKEIWTFTELMKSFYIARQYSDMLYIGGAHQTTNPCKETIQSNEEYNRINNIVIPAIIKEIYNILTPNTESEEK